MSDALHPLRATYSQTGKQKEADARRAARPFTRQMLAVLVSIAHNRAAAPAARVAAAESVLNRAWGRAPQAVFVQGTLTHLTQEQALAELEQRASGHPDAGTLIEGAVSGLVSEIREDLPGDQDQDGIAEAVPVEHGTDAPAHATGEAA